MTLQFAGVVHLPPHNTGGFDHGDVHLASGRVFVAHTALGCIEVIDGERAQHLRSIPGCPEASGVLCGQEDGLVLAAARGAGVILVIDAELGEVKSEVRVGPRPNGLAWDSRRKRALVADVEDHEARLIDVSQSRVLSGARLPGRPRWCAYDGANDRFLVNIREPSCVAVLSPQSLEEQDIWPIAVPGPHGLELDPETGRVFVACDGGTVFVLDGTTGRVLGSLDIAGEPDVIWHSARHARLYVAIGRPGVIDVIDTRRLTRVQQIVTEEGAHTTVFDRARHRLYVFLPRSCNAAIYEEI